MTALRQVLVRIAGLLLDDRERATILGDLEEIGAGPLQCTAEVLGVAFRRHTALWRDWRPWVSGFGLVVPGSFLLMGASISVAWSIRRLSLPEGGAPTVLALQVALLALWSWTGGFVAGSISRKTMWANLALCALPCLFCLSRFRIESLPRLCLLLYLPTAAFGVFVGLRKPRIGRRLSIAVLCGTAALMLVMSSATGMWVANWIFIGPPIYLVATSQSPAPGGKPVL